MPLSDDDRALVARDPALPGLALALDAEALAARLGAGPLVPRYLRYKPAESCTAHFDDGAAGITFRAVTPGRYPIYLAREEWRYPGSPVRYLDDLCAVALPGSLDRGLPGARKLLDPTRAEATLAALLGPGGHHLRVLRHKPGRRLVARIDRAGQPCALVKAVPRAAFPSLLAAAETAAAGGGTAILVHDARRGVLAQAWIAGETVDPRTADPADFTRIGAALATLQRLPATATAPRPHPALDALAAVATLLPDLAAEARALAEALATALPEMPPVFCHGDFNADQIVLTPEGVRIIDWDRSGPGPALADAGSFLARLDADVLAGSLDPAHADALGRAFLAGYADTPPEAVAPRRAASLAALAPAPFRARRPGWAAATAALLARAADLLGPAGLLPRALDRTRMERTIAAAFGRPLRLDPPDLLRDRPGRRALIAYRGREADGTTFEAYGKLRIKALDRRTPALHARLAAGFCGDAGVPAMLGILPEAQIWLQARVDGRLLTDLLARSGEIAPLEATGRALARLHRLSPGRSDPPCWSMADEIAVLTDALGRAAHARPDLAATLGALSADLAARARDLPPGPVTGIHRDFYPDQVIVSPARLWLVDLDLFSLGDPTIDIANFVAHLRELGLRRWGEPRALAPQEDAFLAGYAAVAPLPDPARLDLLTTISLARHLWISIRIPERRHVTDAVVRACSAPAGCWPPRSR